MYIYILSNMYIRVIIPTYMHMCVHMYIHTYLCASITKGDRRPLGLKFTTSKNIFIGSGIHTWSDYVGIIERCDWPSSGQWSPRTNHLDTGRWSPVNINSFPEPCSWKD